jgi:CRP-like cAMP-binding protein
MTREASLPDAAPDARHVEGARRLGGLPGAGGRRALGPGDVFGELALLGDGSRHADVVAVTDLRVLSMFGTHFREMQATLPAVETGLERLADERLAQPAQPA